MSDVWTERQYRAMSHGLCAAPVNGDRDAPCTKPPDHPERWHTHFGTDMPAKGAAEAVSKP